ncbi:hypothetical protein JCM5353_007835 [Sporobolomyces roseus]
MLSPPLPSFLLPRAQGLDDSEHEEPVPVDESGKGGTKIGLILGCVFIVVFGMVFASVGLLFRRKRKKDAARGTRLHDLQSEELVPWLTRGSTGPNLQDNCDSLLPPSTPGYTPPELPPSPGYSRLPMNGHHSAEASQSSTTTGVVGITRVDRGSQGGKEEGGRTPARQTTVDSVRSLPPPYSSGTSGVGTDLTQR